MEEPAPRARATPRRKRDEPRRSGTGIHGRRSVVVFGRAHAVSDEAEKARAMHALVKHVCPGRSPDARPPSEQELAQTLLLALPLEQVSAKIRTGPPLDDEADHALPVWAGVIPLRLAPGAPQGDPLLAAGSAAPVYARRYRRPGGS